MGEQGPVKGRRPGRAWVPVSYGLHRPAQADDLHTCLAAWQLVLPPTGRFTHLTAAEVYGWWLPPLPDGVPVFAAQSRRESRPQRGGLTVFRHADRVPPTIVDGFRVDRVPMLRLALGMADGRSESAWETLLRILHVACGIDVEPQHRLLDEHETEVARADLWLVGTNALHEYDGGEHLKVRRQRSDLARVRRIGNVHWRAGGTPRSRCCTRPSGSCATPTSASAASTTRQGSGGGT
jgi:hypothetical protein